MNPVEFYTLANTLISTNSCPSHCRTAVSRCYYSAYHLAKGLLEDMGFTIRHGPSGHRCVQALLQHSGDEQMKEVGYKLENLHSRRIDADYRLNNVRIETERTVKAILNEVKGLMNIFQTYSKEPTYSRVSNGIKSWSGIVDSCGPQKK